VSLRRIGDQVQLVVEDSGRGMADASGGADARRGLGLMGMRERAQSLAGRFIIENRPEGGTRIVVTLPAGAHATRKAG
jgi:signal transduction histidine kinase